VYYQTQYDRNGGYVSPLGLVRNHTGVTHVIVGAVHLNPDRSVHLNDDPPSAAKSTAGAASPTREMSTPSSGTAWFRRTSSWSAP
jgi:hypothetical protein